MAYDRKAVDDMIKRDPQDQRQGSPGNSRGPEGAGQVSAAAAAPRFDVRRWGVRWGVFPVGSAKIIGSLHDRVVAQDVADKLNARPC